MKMGGAIITCGWTRVDGAKLSVQNIKRNYISVYDRIDATATINFSTQFGAATIRERRLFRSARVRSDKK